MDLLQAELEKIGFEIEQAHRAHRLPSPPNLPDVTIHEEHENAPGLTSPFDLPEDADTNTNYMVLDKECRYRGIFSTNAEGRVFYVILASGLYDPFEGAWRWSHNGKIHAWMSRMNRGSALHPDLNRERLFPNTTYQVDGRFLYHTDSESRVDRVEITHVKIIDSPLRPPRNGWVNRQVRAQTRTRRHDAGHLASWEQGGPNERINLVGMLSTNNRARRRGTVQNNFRAFERSISKLVQRHHHVAIDMSLHYHGKLRVPHSFTVQLYVDHLTTEPITYLN